MKSYSPFFELYKARVREFYRQPARLFWVYGFPLILAVVLGLAFRGGGERPMLLDFVKSGDGGSKALEVLKLKPAKFKVRELDKGVALARLKSGKTPLVVEAGVDGDGVRFHFDPTRPEAVAARTAANARLFFRCCQGVGSGAE